MPASERPQSAEAGGPQGTLDHPHHPPTEHARQAWCGQHGASAGSTATHPRPPSQRGPAAPVLQGEERFREPPEGAALQQHLR